MYVVHCCSTLLNAVDHSAFILPQGKYGPKTSLSAKQREGVLRAVSHLGSQMVQVFAKAQVEQWKMLKWMQMDDGASSHQALVGTQRQKRTTKMTSFGSLKMESENCLPERNKQDFIPAGPLDHCQTQSDESKSESLGTAYGAYFYGALLRVHATSERIVQ